jgi:tetratricopeptide (TPR) repeat protein
MLGGHESGTGRLQEAVAVYREALEEQTRERVPPQWATTQAGLGAALVALGERENGTAHLQEAIAAYREALEEQTRERLPQQWAAIKVSLGDALVTLGERQSDTARLQEAIAAYREALQEQTRERAPLQWAATRKSLTQAQENLGYAHLTRGDFAAAVLNLRDAVDGTSAYPMLWLYLADTRGGGKNAKRDLQKSAASLKPAEWPFPVIELFLGSRAPAAMLAAAQAPAEHCEAQFYLGQWQLLRDKRADAIRALRKAVEICPTDFNEYAGAVAELKRLGR